MNQRPLVLRPSVQRLLALLAVRDDLSRADAAGLLWPDLPDRRAHANLRTVLWRVRVDAPGFVGQAGSTLGLVLDQVEVDARRTREWAWSALQGREPLLPAFTGIGREMLPGWSEEWLIQPREELRILHVYALEAAGQWLLKNGRIGEAANLALAAVNVDPLRESANRLLIEIYLRGGNASDALRHYVVYEHLLRSETGTEPGDGLTALVGAASPIDRRVGPGHWRQFGAVEKSAPVRRFPAPPRGRRSQ